MFNLRPKFFWTKPKEFENIEGYSDIKEIVKRALDSEDNYNLLFCGPPASSRTVFLLGMLCILMGAIPRIVF